MKLWNVIVLANDAADYALAIALLIAVPFFLALAKRLASRLLVNGAPAAMARATNMWLLLPLAVYAATLPLELPPRLDRIAALAALVAMLAQGGIWASRALAAWFERRFRDVRAQDPDGATTLRLIGFAAQGALWLLVGLLALDQLGFDVTALIAGLGIGGVALALAVQHILGDVFACAAIALERRIQFSIAVNYNTPADKLRRIPGWLREAVDAQPQTRFDRAHFKSYGDWALDFEVVYYVLDADYNLHMDVQQSLNVAIYERFAAEGVQFAFPTRTVFVREVKRALRPALRRLCVRGRDAIDRYIEQWLSCMA